MTVRIRQCAIIYRAVRACDFRRQSQSRGGAQGEGKEGGEWEKHTKTLLEFTGNLRSTSAHAPALSQRRHLIKFYTVPTQ